MVCGIVFPAPLLYWVLTIRRMNSGIVVPGLSDAPGAEHDPSNLCLLEATSGSGIACRPLLTVSVRTLFASVSDETELTFILCWIMTRNR